MPDPTIAAGDLDTLVGIFREVDSADPSGYGEAIKRDVLVDEVWASVETQGGREFYRASQVYPTLTHLVTIRYMDGITSKMKVDLDGRKLNIMAVIDVGTRGITLQLPCAEAAV